MKSIIGLTALAFVLLTGLFSPLKSLAQTSPEASHMYIEKAVVTKILSETQKQTPTGKEKTYQNLEAKVLSTPDTGKIVEVDNSYLTLKQGEKFYLTHNVDPNDGIDAYFANEPYRLPWVLFFGALFIATVLIFGGKQGIRGLLSLIASLLTIVYVLLPGILAGYSPILLSIGISSFIIVVGSYLTHGFNRTTTIAVLGMIVTICITGALAYWAVYVTQLTGYVGEAVYYLQFSTNGDIDFTGLLLGGIMIGLLGIMYDAAIGQAVAVEELASAGESLSRKEIYKRAIRIGREHIGALVNTLAIAYVGASLPLLLLLHFSNASLDAMLNQEVFSTEIIRTAIGSMGLILAVPITTVLAVQLLPQLRSRKANKND
jgi:uncharacterized membrane protein